jgi:hypothetical protein
MIEPIILSESNADDALNAIAAALTEPVTYVLVLGSGPNSQAALADILAKINSDSINYNSVRAIHTPEPSHILPVLKQLKVNPDLPEIDWKNISFYVAISITNRHKNIGGVLTQDDIGENTGGKINRIVRWAFALDKRLDGNN